MLFGVGMRVFVFFSVRVARPIRVVMLFGVGMRMITVNPLVPGARFVCVLMLVFVSMFTMALGRMSVHLSVLVWVLILIMRMHGAGMDANLHSLNILALGALEVQVDVSVFQLGKLPFEGGGLDPQITERPHRHVAADAGEAIEEEDTHEK